MSSKGDNDTLLKSHRGSAQWMSLGTREAPLPGVTFNLSKALLKAQVSSVVLSRSGASWKPRAGLQNSRRNHGWKNPWASAHLDSGWAGKERIADLLLQAQEVRKALPGCSGTKPVLRDWAQQLAPDQGVLMARVFQHQKKKFIATGVKMDGSSHRWWDQVEPWEGRWEMTVEPDSFLIIPDCGPIDHPLPFRALIRSKHGLPSPHQTKQPPPSTDSSPHDHGGRAEIKWWLTWARLGSHEGISAFQQHGDALLLNTWATRKKEHMLTYDVLPAQVYRQRHKIHRMQLTQALRHLGGHLNSHGKGWEALDG